MCTGGEGGKKPLSKDSTSITSNNKDNLLLPYIDNEPLVCKCTGVGRLERGGGLNYSYHIYYVGNELKRVAKEICFFLRLSLGSGEFSLCFFSPTCSIFTK